jgi:hypothetical protein
MTEDTRKYRIYFNSSEFTGETTWLIATRVIEQPRWALDTKNYILNGDHRAAYAELKTLKECLQYFLDNKHLINEFSEKLGV